MNLSKNNRFSAEEAVNYIPCAVKKRRYQYVKCLSPLGLYPPPCFQFDHGTEDNSIQGQLYDSSII